jgi:DNA-binding PadR family transcriptional regulator
MSEKVYGFSFGADDWGWMWGDETPRHRRRRRHRHRRVRFESGEMRYVILSLLKDKPMHGYEVMKALTEETDGWYKPSPGTVYPTLQWLEDEGLVRCEEKDGKKIYHITDDGLRFLEENQDTVDDIFERIADTIEQVFSDPMPDVTRLVGTLLGKTYKAAWKMRNDEDLQEELVAILETAIQKVDNLQGSGSEADHREEEAGPEEKSGHAQEA